MHKIIFSSFIMASALLATDGYDIYQKNCSSCHVEMMTKSYALKNFKKLKAPPMVEVSGRLKENIIIKDDEEDIHRHLFILFVKEYIQNPQLDYSMCTAGAIETFGVMPSLKEKLSEEEREAVAEWLYDRYENVEFE
jgi:uncharacterized protein YggL (DUF469 family)